VTTIVKYIMKDTRYIQLRGKVETQKDFEMGEQLAVRVIVTAIEEQDNNDGAKNIIYKCRLWGEDA